MSERLTPEPKTRRDILSWAAIGTASVTVLGSSGAMARLIKPRLLPEAASRFSIGHPDEFMPGTERIISERNVVIVADQGGVAAISLICTHLGCIVARTAQGFSCPCHGSKFDEAGLLAACNDALEELIRRNPAEWVWFHRRWENADDGIETVS